MLTTDRFITTAELGTVVMPDDDGWDAARQAFNLLVDQRPVAVAMPADEREVAAVVRAAALQGLQVAPQCTGHNAAPLGSLEKTVLLNTSRLTGVRIDARARRVRAGAATKWEHVTPQLSELGLAALHGSSPDVGIVGYSLGGGVGWLARSHGLQCNSVTAIELVTADGDLIRTDAVHEPELFWALRGGGGNFGVVTAIEFDVYPISSIYAGGLFFPFERAGEIVRVWRDSLVDMPETMTTWMSLLHFPDLPFVPEPVRGRSFAIVLGAFTGSEPEGRELLSRLRAEGPTMDTFAVVAPEGLAELAMDPPSPVPYMTAHDIAGGLADETIDALVNAVRPESGLGGVQLRHLGGALSRRPSGAGARADLPGHVMAFSFGMVLDSDSGQTVARSLQAVTDVFATEHAGLYASFVEEPSDASEFYDAETWDRLCGVKALYDPGDVFRGNHHVPPAA
jgi:FAD/FMN-containing dehydrogenase